MTTPQNYEEFGCLLGQETDLRVQTCGLHTIEKTQAHKMATDESIRHLRTSLA